MRRGGALGLIMAAFLVLTSNADADSQNLKHRCGNTKISTAFTDTVYNALNNNGEGKIGPRRLVVNQSGNLLFGGTRNFIGHTPMDLGKVTLAIKKKDGRAKTEVTVCSTGGGPDFKQKVHLSFTIQGGRGNIGTTFNKTIEGLKNRRLSVRFNSKSVTDEFEYSLEVNRAGENDVWLPSQEQLSAVYRPVEGFADLHAHHAGGFAFASGWYIGGMEQSSVDSADHAKRLKVNIVGIPATTLRQPHQGKTIPSWDDASQQQMNLNALKGAHDNGLGLMVAPAVNSEWLCSVLAYAKEIDKRQSCQDMESAKFQILKMKQFDDKYGWYDIVTNPWEARTAALAGRLPVVLGVEVSDLFPRSDGDWKKQLTELYSMGVRVVSIAHESNSLFAGAAYHHTETLLFPNQLKAWFSRDIEFASMGDDRNEIGLTAMGEELIREMMRKKMLIDVDHASWNAVLGIFNITSANRFYPIYSSHSRPNELLTDYMRSVVPELNTPPAIFDFIRRSGGMIGMRTGPDAMLRYEDSGVANNCAGSVKSLIQMYRFIEDGGVAPAFGSDFNGFVPTTGPRFGNQACPGTSGQQRIDQMEAQVQPNGAGAPPSWSRYLTRGMSDIGTEPAVIFDMQKLGVDTEPLENSAQAFIKMWGRAYRSDRTEIP